MKTLILCGGRGTRLGKTGEGMPKALVEIGGKPILWHLLKIYSSAGLNDFIICLGYRGDQIREFFLGANDASRSDSSSIVVRDKIENWRVTLVDTGLDTNTGGRIARVKNHLENEDAFCVTYGDGLANVNLRQLLDFHAKSGRVATLTAVKPYSSFGVLEIEHDLVTKFAEKPRTREWINGGFFVFRKQVLGYLDEDSVLEQSPLKSLARENQLAAFRHEGFWKCMDTHKDNLEFNEMWNSGDADWKVW